MCSGCFQYLKIFLQLNISNRSPPSLDQACLVPVVVFDQVSCCLHLLPQLLLSSIGLPPLGDFAYSQLHILQRCHRCQRWNHTMDRTDTWKPKKDISGTFGSQSVTAKLENILKLHQVYLNIIDCDCEKDKKWNESNFRIHNNSEVIWDQDQL